MILFFISLILIIFCHELAHLLAAKKCGCGVDIFSIGFGKPIYRKEYKGTIYQITPILLGGYCKLQDELTNSQDSQSFTNQPYHKKVLIALAGVITNMIMGLLILYLGKFFNINKLIYFGYLSFLLGATNALPFPALDGSYPILVWLEKFPYRTKFGLSLSDLLKLNYNKTHPYNCLCGGDIICDSKIIDDGCGSWIIYCEKCHTTYDED